MSNSIGSDLFNLGSLTQDESGRLTLSSKIDGFDPKDMVKALREAKAKSSQIYQDKIDFNQKKIIPNLQDLELKLQAVLNATHSLTGVLPNSDQNVFNARTVKINSEEGLEDSRLVAKITGREIQNQTCELVVEKLAQQALVLSEPLFFIDQPLNAFGSLTINDSVVEIDSMDTIKDVVFKINHASQDVFASVIKSNNDTFYLSLRAKNFGSPMTYSGATSIIQALSLPNDPTSIASNTDLLASFSLDGIEMSAQKNIISDAIDGLEIEFLKADPAKKITLSVQNDKTAIKDQLHLFANSYNALIETIGQHSQYEIKNWEFKPKDDAYLYELKILKSIKNLFLDLAQVNTDSAIGSFSDVGIEVNKFKKTKIDPLMSIDDTKLDRALSGNFDDVKNFFCGFSTSSGAISLKKMPDTMSAGDFSVSVFGEYATLINKNGEIFGFNAQNGVIKGSDAFEGLVLFYPENQNVQNETLIFSKGIMERLNQKIGLALDKNKSRLPNAKTAFDLEFEALEEKNKLIQKKIDTSNKKFDLKIKNLEAKMQKIYDMRKKTHNFKKAVEAFMEKDKK